MQKVIGLDIGSYSIKAVEIINKFKSYEITNFYEVILPEVENVSMDAVVAQSMEQLFRENNLEADRIITAMPGQWISSRVIPFGFSDSRKIEAAIQSEVEDVVPFNLEDMIIDHQILGNANGKTLALVVMTRKEFLRNFLELLHRIKIDPKLIDVDSLAFYNLSTFMPVEANDCYGIVDIGHEKTSLCIMRDGLLRMFRSINLGGRYLAEFLARDLEVSYTEAQKIKHRVSRAITSQDAASDLTGDDKIICERLTLACNSLIKELGRTLYSFKSFEKTPIAKIYISGGTTKIANFPMFLQEQLEMPTEKIELDRTQLKLSTDLGRYMEVMPQSVAIGLRMVSAVKRHSRINLRKGSFAYVQDYESLIRGAFNIGKIVAAAMAVLIVMYGIRAWFDSRQMNKMREEYVRELKEVFPDIAIKSGTSAPYETMETLKNCIVTLQVGFVRNLKNVKWLSTNL